MARSRLSVEEFAEEVAAFVAAHAPQRGEVWADRGWLAALKERGWQTPSWPRELGGADWTATETYLWRRACLSIPDYRSNDAIDRVGPILWTHQQHPAAGGWLADIADFAAEWCLATVDTLQLQVEETSAARVQGNWELSGTKDHVSFAVTPFVTGKPLYMLASARISTAAQDELEQGGEDRWGLFVTPVVPAQLSVTTLLDGSKGYSVTLSEASAECIAEFASFADFRAALVPLWSNSVGGSAIARGQLAIARRQLTGFVDDEERDELKQQADAVEINLLSLEAMEARYIDALERRETPPFPVTSIEVLAQKTLSQTGALLVDIFGYYALPHPDELTTHNEPGLNGLKPEDERAARVWLRQAVADNYMNLAQPIYDKLADDLEAVE